MATLVIEREKAETANTGTADAAAEDDQSRPAARFVATIRAVEKGYIAVIFAIVLLRGLDLAMHG